MTTYNFSSLIGQTITGFNVDSDVLAILNTGPEVTVTTSGSNTVVTTAAGSVTLASVSMSQLTSTNLTVNGGTAYFGESTTATALDVAGNTISAGSGSNLIYGLGGGDTITVGNGNNLIFGGSAVVDTADGGDTISLGSGTNTLYANGGNDVVTFGTVTASGKVSTAYLGGGDDSYTSGASIGNHSVLAGAGNDTLNFTGATGDATVYGGASIADTTDGNDTITLGTGSYTVYANAGTDTLNLGAAVAGKTVTAYLGLGNDTVATAAAPGNIVIYGNGGSDSIGLSSVTGDVTVYGGNGISDTTDSADTIVAGTITAGGNSTVYGNAGDDNITVNTNISKVGQVFGGAGADTITINAGAPGTTVASFLITGGDGNDTINGNFETGVTDNVADVVVNDFATGDVFNITLAGGAGATGLNVSGNGSSITIYNDLATAGTYNLATEERITLITTANLSATNFVISGGTKLITNFSTTATTLTGGAAADHLVSGDAADTIVGGGGVDKLIGGAGADVFQFTAALAGAFDSTATTVTGGDGTDTLEVTDASAVTMAANDFTSTITGMEILKLSNITGHSITTGTAFATAGFTTINADALTGTATLGVTGGAATAGFYLDADGATTTGVMTITTGTGNDTINSGAGADAITLSTGNDSVNAGAGEDTITFTAPTSWTSSDTLAGGSGTLDTITLGDISPVGAGAVVDSNFTNVTGFERLLLVDGGTAAAQSITLGTAASAAGLTQVNGIAETSHTVTMDASAMTSGIALLGGSIGDSLTGGTGNDTLYGGIGGTVDTLVGGAGSDRYAVSNTATAAVNGIDLIASSNFTAGSSGDIFDFDYNNVSFNASLTETIVTNAAASITYAAAGNNGVLVVTNDAFATNAAALQTALDAAGDLDTGGSLTSRVIVWETSSTSVGVGLVSSNGTNTAVQQLFTLTGFANQTAVDSFTSGLVIGNFDLV